MIVFWTIFTCINVPTLYYVRGEDLVENTTNPTTNAEETTTFKIELFPLDPVYAGQTRMPRKFFGKLHSGVAFLTGLKLGTVLSKKGFELGHGKIASTHSFQMFGKPVNSAMSLSYGNVASLLPLVDDDPGTEISDEPKKKSSFKKEDRNINNVYHVTVIENPSVQAFEKLQSISNRTNAEEQKNDTEEEDRELDKINENILRVIEEPEVEESKAVREKIFLEEHNKIVNAFNQNFLKRTNSKFKLK